jgi:tryptophan-rich sensory protein
MNKINRILAVVVTCLAIGYFSGMVTRSAITTWYPTLIKPSLIHPIGFLHQFGYLYVMMGVRRIGLGPNRS